MKKMQPANKNSKIKKKNPARTNNEFLNAVVALGNKPLKKLTRKQLEMVTYQFWLNCCATETEMSEQNEQMHQQLYQHDASDYANSEYFKTISCKIDAIDVQLRNIYRTMLEKKRDQILHRIIGLEKLLDTVIYFVNELYGVACF